MAEHLNLLPVALLLIGAVAGGLLLAGLRQPPLVGYIIAGAVFGPSGLALITDRVTIDIFAELGVLVLLFVVGTHLSLRAFKNIYRTAVGAASLQILVSVSLMLLLGHLFGWRAERAILYGFVLALSSTAVGIKILEDVGELRNEAGRVAVGVLIAQDLAVVPMLIIIVGMASPEGVDLPALLLKLALAVAALTALIWFLSRRQRTHLPFRRLWVRHPDLAPIGALALCVIGAAVSGALELSAGLGAFLAGLYVGNTTERAVMVRAMDPIQSLLLMMFFLSVGLLIDLAFVMRNLTTVLLLTGFVFLLNSVINVGALRAVGAPWRVAFLAGFALAQVGEFAFVLAATGVASGLIGEEAQRMVVAVIALTMVVSPMWLELARRLHALQEAPPERLALLVARLARDEARVLRLRSARLVQGGAWLAADLGGRIERVNERYRGPRHRAAAARGPAARVPTDSQLRREP
jgi:CPA2 family monovalent cation:H+ antiporter-2